MPQPLERAVTAADWTAAYPARPGAPLVLYGATLAADLSCAQIAGRLGVSPHAVHGRLRRLYQDLDVHNRVGAVCTAMACGLLDAPTPKGNP